MDFKRQKKKGHAFREFRRVFQTNTRMNYIELTIIIHLYIVFEECFLTHSLPS